MNDRKVLAVAGRPILRSLSPVLFRAAYRGDRDASVYTRISASTPEEALRFGRELGLAGLNITAPLKDGVFALLDACDETSAAIGAVNTIVREGQGFRGFNTDPAGVIGAFEDSGVDVRGRRCLVLGAGGAGRAAGFALRGLGADIVLCSRNDARAQAAARRLGVAAAKWADLASVLDGCHILVSCLPPDAASVPPDRLRPELVVLEAAYPEPPLSRAARAKGCRVLSGERWLFRQAVPAFRLLTGAEPDEGSMAEALRGAPRRFSRSSLNIALVGFMGAGKTTIGRRLAEKFGLAFEDSDARIERMTGRSVPAIFLSEGEAAFRREERRALKDILAGRSGVVCACGGGSMESGESRAFVAANAIVVWLHASLDVCRSRADPATRPLLDRRLNSEAEIKALFRARISCYAEASDIAIGSEGPEELTSRTVYEEICRVIED